MPICFPFLWNSIRTRRQLYMGAKDIRSVNHMSQLLPAAASWQAAPVIRTDLIWHQPGRFIALGVVHTDPTHAKVPLTSLGSAAS